MRKGHHYRLWAAAALMLLSAGCGGTNESSQTASAASSGTVEVSSELTISSSSAASVLSSLTSVAASSTAPSVKSSAATSHQASSAATSSAPGVVVHLTSSMTSSGSGNVLVDMGLGEKETAYVSPNRDYEWYIDQLSTGDYGVMNCGPTCVGMACKWYNKDFSTPVADIRAAINVAANNYALGGTSFPYLVSSLNGFNVPNEFRSGLTLQTACDEIAAGNILIVGMDMWYITFEPNVNYHVNQFNAGYNGHFFLIKGYRIVDGVIWFECYDPFSRGQKYADGQFKGKDRYYRADEVLLGNQKCGNRYVVVGGNAVSGPASLPVSAAVSG